MAVTLEQVNKLFTFGGTSRLTPELVISILDLYSKKEGGPDAIVEILKKPPYNIAFNRSIIQRTVNTAIDAKIIERVPVKEMKTIVAQKIYESPADRKIYKTIREITHQDRITTQYTNPPKWANYKIQFQGSGNIPETSVVPKKFLGIQYYKTKELAEAALKAESIFDAQEIKKIPFEKAVKEIHKLALKDPEIVKSSNFDKLAQQLYGIAKKTKNRTLAQDLLPKQSMLANDFIKYQEFLLGFNPIKGLVAPTAVQLNDILFELPAPNYWGKFNNESLRRSKLKIRDQLLKTKGPKLRILRDNIIKYTKIKGMNLDEAMGISATFEKAPGYTELGQLITEEINIKKNKQIDQKFSRLLARVVEGETGSVINTDIKNFNTLSRNFQKTWKVDTPIIEYKPGQVLDPSKFIKHFDKLSPEARVNIGQLAEKGIGLRSRAMPMIEMLYDIYKKSEGADRTRIQTILGCRPAAASGGRIGFASGTLDVCVNTKLNTQTLESGQKIVAGIEEGATGVLGKIKNVARGVLGALGKFGPAAGKFGALAAVGAVAQPLVRQFMNDDSTTYLTDPDQQAGMLDALLEGKRPKPRSEILDWGLGAGEVGAVAAAVPGSGALYKYRRGLSETKIPRAGPITESGLTAGDYLSRHAGKGYGKLRAGAGVGLKALSGMFTPAGILATEPLRIAQKRREGESWGEIAKSPTMWMGPAFAPAMTKIATAGMKKGSGLATILRLGLPRVALGMMGPIGWAGLAISTGLTGYDLYQDYRKKRGFFASDEE